MKPLHRVLAVVSPDRTLAVVLLAMLASLVMATGQARADPPSTLKVTSDTTLTEDFVGNVVIARSAFP